MNDPLLQLQLDTTDKLNSEAFYEFIPVQSVRKLLTSSTVENPAQLFIGKHGRSGHSVLVGMPTLVVEHPDVPGPDLTIQLPIRHHELRDLNMSSGGTLIECEAGAMQTLRTLHTLAIEGLCELYADRDSMKPVEEFEGIVSYELTLKGRLPTVSLSKTPTPQITEGPDAYVVTLTNVLAGAAVYYTLDGTFPGPGNLNPDGSVAALLYAGPIQTQPPVTIRWAAYAPGLIGSDVAQAQINP